MNGKNILIGLSYIDRKLIEEAEMDTIPAAHRGSVLRKPFLLAAVIALMLALVGCAVVYAMKMHDLKIGERTVVQTQDFDTEAKQTHLDVLSLQGIQNSPAYLANQEWLAFTNSYTPQRGDYWESPEAYWAYNVLDQNMVDKVDELCNKYGLKVIG